MSIIKILVIDDNISLGKVIPFMLKRSLKKLNIDVIFDIDFVLDGESGIKASKEKKYDFVISDFVMPTIDGEETLDVIRKIYPNMGVCILSAWVDIDKDSDYEQLREKYKVFIKTASGDDVCSYIIEHYKTNHDLIEVQHAS